MNRIILADWDPVFCIEAARVLAEDENMQIVAQCRELEPMYHAIADLPGSTVLFAASLHPDLTRLRILLEITGSRGVVIAETRDAVWPYLERGFAGAVFRNVAPWLLLGCVRRVASGDTRVYSDADCSRLQTRLLPEGAVENSSG